MSPAAHNSSRHRGLPSPAPVTVVSFSGTCLRLCFEDTRLAEQARGVKVLLEHFIHQDPSSSPIDIVIKRGGAGVWIKEESPTGLSWVCDEKESLIVFLDSVVHEVLGQHLTAAIGFHAGVVGPPNRPVLLLGESGMGKSTLTYELLQSGWHYWSDDFAVLSFTTGCCAPYPKAIKFEGYHPKLVNLPRQKLIRGRIGAHVHSYLLPWNLPGFQWGQPAPVAAVVELTRNAASKPVLTVLSPRETLEVLAMYGGFHKDRLAPEFDLLCQVARNCPGRRLAMGKNVRENALVIRNLVRTLA